MIRRHPALYATFAAARDTRDRAIWTLRGRSTPPPGVFKRELLRAYAKRFHLRTLVETGTFLGDTIWALRHDFDLIHSVELDAELFRRARQRFVNIQHVQIHHGDSGELLARILAKLAAPALFWLDGHYSGVGTARSEVDSPLTHELLAVLRRKEGHVVLIDDARLLTGINGYPTVDELHGAVRSSDPAMQVILDSDIVAIFRSTALRQ